MLNFFRFLCRERPSGTYHLFTLSTLCYKISKIVLLAFTVIHFTKIESIRRNQHFIKQSKHSLILISEKLFMKSKNDIINIENKYRENF